MLGVEAFGSRQCETSNVAVRHEKTQIAQTDQSLRCPHDINLGPYFTTERTAMNLIILGGRLG